MNFKDYCVIEEGMLDKIADYFDIDGNEVKRVAKLWGVTWGVILVLVGLYNYNKLSSPEKEAVDSLRDKPGIEDILQPIVPNRELPVLHPNNLPPLPHQLPVGPPPDAVGPPADNNATFDQYLEHFAREEGSEETVYDDSEGNPTIGIGHHLDSSADDRITIRVVLPDVNYDRLLDGTQDLNATQISDLFSIDLTEHLDRSRAIVPAFENVPDYVQIAIADGAYRGDLPQSPDTLEHINNGRWIEAAVEYIDNDEYRDSRRQGPRHGVWQRMDRNAAAYRRYGETLQTP